LNRLCKAKPFVGYQLPLTILLILFLGFHASLMIESKDEC